MRQLSIVKNNNQNSSSLKLLHNILGELKIIRKELSLVIPHEDIGEYSHSERIKQSYKRALKNFPVSSS